jgi:TRAP-type C4-dicarboxylate transport system permease small subunit
VNTFIEKIERVFETIMAILTAFLIVVALYQVLGRYFLGTDISWTEETMRYVFVTTVMLGIYFMTKHDSFATMTIFSDYVQKKSKNYYTALKLFRYIVQIVFYFLLFYYGINACIVAMGRVTIATQIPLSLVYLPMPIGGFMGCVNIAIRGLRDFGVIKNKAQQVNIGGTSVTLNRK